MYFNALNIVGYEYYKKFFKLLKFYNWDAKYVWTSFHKLNLQKFGFSCSQISKIKENYQKIDPENEFEKLQRQKISTIPYCSPYFPTQLKEISDPPFMIYLKGEIPSIPLVAIVGTRIPTDNGNKAVNKFTSALSQFEVGIISGLAYGIDARAHQCSLNSKIVTGAVLGSGLANVYPANHLSLSVQINESGGFLLTEFPLDTKPTKYSFPRRNRIISGLSKAVIVVEAGIKSGALITAEYALQQNRDVLVVPGSIFEKNYQGSLELLKQGAFVMSDITDLLNLQPLKPKLDPNASLIFEKLSYKKFQSQDDLFTKIKLEKSLIAKSILELEIKKLITSNSQGEYKKNFLNNLQL